MSLCMSWLAVKGKTPVEILEILAQEWEKRPWDKDYESPMHFVDVQNGWYVLQCYPDDFFRSKRDLRISLSKNAEVIICTLDENSHMSAAYGIVNEVEMWEIKHDKSIQRNHLVSVGETPECFDRLGIAMVEEYERLGKGDCYFDIPEAGCREITHYVSNGDPRKLVLLPIPFLE